MNRRWQKQRRLPPSLPTAIECDGSQLLQVLAKLRRAGAAPGEPLKIGPNRWRVIPTGATGRFEPDKYGEGDRCYVAQSFSQLLRGQLEY